MTNLETLRDSVVAIPLSQGYSALVDVNDAEAVRAQGSWHAHRTPLRRTLYARRNARVKDGSRITSYMHTFLTGYLQTDHRNGEGLDNRRVNLRPATNFENGANSRVSKNNKSGYIGVSWHELTKKMAGGNHC